MNLKKQLFTTFMLVAILPLVIVSLYMFGVNVSLAFHLYEQDMYNSTEIQADVLDEHVNRMIVRTEHFAQSNVVKQVCARAERNAISVNDEFSNEVQDFTDETLDSIHIFALFTNDRELLYSSGSVSDTERLKEKLQDIELGDHLAVMEMDMGDTSNCLAIYSPVKDGGKQAGGFVTILKTDYFLKSISSHKQLESSNAFIYCRNHHKSMVSKKQILGDIPELEQESAQDQGNLICMVGNEYSMVQYKAIAHTNWLLVSNVSLRQIVKQIFNYGAVSILVFVLAVTVIFVLSRSVSSKILKPMKRLLSAVEQFVLVGGKFPELQVNSKTEIGYLAAKFSRMSDEVTDARSKLEESNFLYNTLLKATYEFRIVIDLKTDEIQSSSRFLEERLKNSERKCASERVLDFLEEKEYELPEGRRYLLRDMLSGRKKEPAEVEVCCNMGRKRENNWYRMICVPIVEEDREVERVVLHFEDITDKKEEEQRLIQSSQTDPLCGMLNKNAFLAKCGMYRTNTKGAFFFIDLDCFKMINDTFGHAEGDETLVAASKKIKENFRSQDVLGRYGGDEFVVFAPEMDEKQAAKKAEMLVKNIIFERETPEKTIICVTTSVGVYMITEKLDPISAVEEADAAMYYAKQNGKSRYHMIRGEERTV